MKAAATKQDARQLTRELLAWRLYVAYLNADAQGYRFSAGELRALMDVRRWPDERLKKAIRHYESVLKR